MTTKKTADATPVLAEPITAEDVEQKLTGLWAWISAHAVEIAIAVGVGTAIYLALAYVQRHARLYAERPPDRLSLIHNGVDLDLYTPDRDGVAFRQTVGIPLDAPLVGFVGRLEHEKGPDFFVRAADEVHRRRPDTHFVLVGQGAMQGELERMIRDMGLGGHVHLAGKWTNTAEVYPAFDILVCMSKLMALGMPFIDVLAAAGAKSVIQPGGSLRDEEVIAAADEHGIAMVFTGARHFRH